MYHYYKTVNNIIASKSVKKLRDHSEVTIQTIGAGVALAKNTKTLTDLQREANWLDLELIVIE